MNDMRAVIVPKSDQTNTDDLIAGPITITITGVKITPGTEQPVSIGFEGDNGKPWKPCKSMSRVLVHCWGPDAREYTGRSLRLYCDPKVTWGGMAVGGIRISHLSHIDAPVTMALTATKQTRKLFTVHPLVVEKAAPPPEGVVVTTIPLEPPKRTRAQFLDEFEANVKAALAAPNAAENVDRIICGDDVLRAKSQFRNGHLERLNSIIANALAALRTEWDDDGPLDIVGQEKLGAG